ncbi:MAG: hypothetical protein ACPG1A_08545 [Halioglobus sp.]
MSSLANSTVGSTQPNVISYPHVYGPDPEREPNLAALLSQLEQRFNNAVCCTLVYGSCLRSGDIYDGLLDLYLIVDDYSAAYGRGFMAGANWLLPPNVFYAEQHPVPGGENQVLRSKVTVISLPDFQQRCSTDRFESYIWGRFAQPTRLLRARDDAARADVIRALANASGTLLQNALPALPASGKVTDLWEQALGLSYATELRTERAGRAGELARSSADFYAAMSRAHAGRLAFPFEVEEREGQWFYRSETTAGDRRKSRLRWATRRIQGKLLSISRLVKALFTFDGGLDYIAWKLERHSGEEIVIPPRVRRAPLIFMWPFFWGLYRRGIFK